MAQLRIIVVLLSFSLSKNVIVAESGTQAEVPTIHLLALVPMTETAGLPYQGGEGLISVAQLAVDEINMRDDILPAWL